MSSPEPGKARGSRGPGDPTPRTRVDLDMSFDEADAFTVLLAEAVEAWEKHGEQTHSARLNAMHFRTLRNKIKQIRGQLPDGYDKEM